MSKKNSIILEKLSIADLKDEEIKAVLAIRKQYSVDERDELIKGLYFMSQADDDYSSAEEALVKNTAYTLGINDEKLSALTESITAKSNLDKILSDKNSKKFKIELFSEMVSLTYIKGYQTAEEEKLLRKVAKDFKISEKNAENILEEKYFTAHGIKRPSSSTAAKIGIGVGVVVASAAIVAMTAGAAAPVIGTLLGNAAGFSGAAATAHGLALLGGGTLAAGGMGVAGGTAAIVTAGGIVGASAGALGVSVAGNINSAYDKNKLKSYVIKQMKEDKTLQEITDDMLEAISLQKKRIEALEKANASKIDLKYAQEVYNNLTAQKDEVETLYLKNGKK